MSVLSQGNAKVDPDSGAVFYQPSPELKLLKEINDKLDRLEKKIDQLTPQREEGEPNDIKGMEISR